MMLPLLRTASGGSSPDSDEAATFVAAFFSPSLAMASDGIDLGSTGKIRSPQFGTATLLAYSTIRPRKRVGNRVCAASKERQEHAGRRRGVLMAILGNRQVLPVTRLSHTLA